jgi:hypothetical protein
MGWDGEGGGGYLLLEIIFHHADLTGDHALQENLRGLLSEQRLFDLTMAGGTVRASRGEGRGDLIVAEIDSCESRRTGALTATGVDCGTNSESSDLSLEMAHCEFDLLVPVGE